MCYNTFIFSAHTPVSYLFSACDFIGFVMVYLIYIRFSDDGEFTVP